MQFLIRARVAFEDPLLMDELYSWFDGLNDWSELTAVSVKPSVDERNIPYQLEFMLRSEPGVGMGSR